MGAAPTWFEGKTFVEGYGYLTPGKEYWYVDMGPIPDLPAWHVLSEPASYAFPTLASATGFAHRHQVRDPERSISIRHPREA